MTGAKRIKRPLSDYQLGQLQAANEPEKFIEAQLAECGRKYESGNSRALATALQIVCWAATERPHLSVRIPDWAAVAFYDGYVKMLDQTIASWDSVLGGNVKTEKRLAGAARNRRLQVQLVRWIDQPENRSKSIDNSFYEDIAQFLKISPSAARNLYQALDSSVKLPSSRRRKPAR